MEEESLKDYLVSRKFMLHVGAALIGEMAKNFLAWLLE